LRPVISVLLLDYVDLASSRLHSIFHILEKHDHQRFTDALEMHVIELPKLDQTSDTERSEEGALVRWSRFFAADTDAAIEEEAMGDPAIREAATMFRRTGPVTPASRAP
jgi:predicted transposase/invertase (TIGR01784 family)